MTIANYIAYTGYTRNPHNHNLVTKISVTTLNVDVDVTGPGLDETPDGVQAPEIEVFDFGAAVDAVGDGASFVHVADGEDDVGAGGGQCPGGGFTEAAGGAGDDNRAAAHGR